MRSRATLYIYGSAACILLDEPHRSSLDVDVAGPYSVADERDLRQAAEAAGLPINPDEGYSGDHIEWVGPLRLCLQPPMPGKGLTLWEGARLQVRTGEIAELVSSKLIRYDDLDRSDIQYLLATSRIPFAEVERAVERLPTPFVKVPLIHEGCSYKLMLCRSPGFGTIPLRIWNPPETHLHGGDNHGCKDYTTGRQFSHGQCHGSAGRPDA